MMITPLRMLFPASRLVGWFLRHRKHFGVAAFLSAALHTVLYVLNKAGWLPMLSEFWQIGIWTGWLAMLIFLLLSLTSNNFSVMALGGNWKPLQRTVYAAACATLVHWLFVSNDAGAALACFIPLALLETNRIWRYVTAAKRSRSAMPATL